ncbi:diacylglycerol kinase family enzyme [Kribbella orskensis]|uniref:Diacylglycerol kinase family enzyme n=1 Tax=Kribbella orskensis TaxID=2512216 RepID=A0ABY2B954_9ACTN|nr:MULTISPECIES: diacylglycerol kinase family protein [Kribbella]TCN31702.1 diacylglycerol kinase family enzyme [Kribbella sp. VKM Ac-2500]TCO12292.1 diacylglycerol kinase family enzyme [Kribbella orskensis]
MRRRLAAAVALLVGLATIVLGVVVAVDHFPRGLGLLVCVVIAAAAAWYGVLRRGTARVVGLTVAGLALAGALAFLIAGGGVLAVLVVVAGLLATLAAARASYASHVDLPSAPAPKRAVLFYNPLSGGGKAERFALAEEARKRGIEPIELKRGDDLEVLVRRAVESGADGLAMAGGDGSQAVVAAIAAELSLPYACVPAGTRNHFALDLGVDRDDVVGALDAFVDGGERLVDLAEVNGRVFVNNVSLGLYAEAVQRTGYRAAKIRTILDTVPDVLGTGGSEFDMRWSGPGGNEHSGGAAVLVSNNKYRLGRAVGSGTRPRIDDGLLGITVIGKPSGDGEAGGALQRPWREWSATSFEVDADRPLPAGVDGEALVFDAPLRFRIRPGVLRVRIAPQHPGSSPSARAPEGLRAALAELVRIALGRESASSPRTRP